MSKRHEIGEHVIFVSPRAEQVFHRLVAPLIARVPTRHPIFGHLPPHSVCREKRKIGRCKRVKTRYSSIQVLNYPEMAGGNGVCRCMEELTEEVVVWLETLPSRSWETTRHEYGIVRDPRCIVINPGLP